MKQRYFFLVGCVILALALLACGESTSGGTAPATAAATPTLAFQLASIDNPGTTPDAPTQATYQKLLDSLHDKTGDPEQAISDETVKAQQLLQGKGKTATLLELMKGVDGAITKQEHQKYAESIAALITIMENK